MWGMETVYLITRYNDAEAQISVCNLTLALTLHVVAAPRETIQ